MKLLDDVRIIKLNEDCKRKGITKDMILTIIDAAIRDNEFLLLYSPTNPYEDEIYTTVYVGDLELVQDNKMTDSQILEDIPKHNPKWWCKVEDGYIMNLLGEKKNKIPYDYNS